jgi:hypothetical protein
MYQKLLKRFTQLTPTFTKLPNSRSIAKQKRGFTKCEATSIKIQKGRF